MAQLNEQEEQLKDQKYLDGFNIGYQLQKQLEDKNLSNKDRNLITSMTKAMSKSKSDNDKVQGMLDGKQQRLKEIEKQKFKLASKQKDQEHER